VHDHQGYQVPWLRLGVRRFRLTLAALLRAPSPVSFETGSSSKTSAPLQSASFTCPPHRSSFGEAPSRGFLPSWRPQPEASTRFGIPRPRTHSVLGVSHALDGLLRFRPCGSISPRCRLQGSLFRGFPLGEAASSHRRPLPSCRWQMPAARWLPTRLHAPSPRLQGVLPHRDPLQHRRGLVVCAARSPPELRLLQVLTLLVVGAPSRPLRS
jgi:hypothetical protein